MTPKPQTSKQHRNPGPVARAVEAWREAQAATADADRKFLTAQLQLIAHPNRLHAGLLETAADMVATARADEAARRSEFAVLVSERFAKTAPNRVRGLPR